MNRVDEGLRGDFVVVELRVQFGNFRSRFCHFFGKGFRKSVFGVRVFEFFGVE